MLYLLLQLLWLAGVLRFLAGTRKPQLCAGLYAGFPFAMGLLLRYDVLWLLLSTLASFGYAWLWFWVLVEKCATQREWQFVVVGGVVAPILFWTIVLGLAKPAA